MDSSDEDTLSQEEVEKKRGVKRGTKRGKYRTSNVEKKRILAAAMDDEGDWRAMAVANGVAIGTAYGWIRNADREPQGRGGARGEKVQQRHIERMIEYVEENREISLTEIRRKLSTENGDTQISISTTTIHKYLHGQAYTVKKNRTEPWTMNSHENKDKRRLYVQDIMNEIGSQKKIIYIDETNVNLFLRRNFGRSKKGSRCCVKAPTSRGKNVHVIGGIANTGMVYWERRRGSFTKPDCQEWTRRLLRASGEEISSIVIVLDNAPVHSDLEAVAQEEEFEGVTFLRLAPYSAPLNPIEECWSVFKSKVKRILASRMPELMESVPAGVTQTEHRLQCLESIIDESIPIITPDLCYKTHNHVQKVYPDCLQMKDLEM